MKIILFRIVGRIAFWLSWPFTYFYLKDSQRVRVLIICGQELVLLENWHGDGKWTVPGGGVEDGETNEQAAVREVQEETGLTIAASKLLNLGSYLYHDHGLKFAYQGFYIQLAAKEYLHGRWPEILRAQWTPLEDLHRLAFEPSVTVLLDAWKQQV